MNKIRIIPRLDIKGPNLVKGIHLEGLRVLGLPDVFCKKYYEDGADEIFYMDTVASLYERNSLSDIIKNTATDMFIPFTVGGGLRSIEDIRNALKSGADKVCINTAAIKKPDFINEAARLFGSSTIVIAIEAIKQSDGQYFAFMDNGREESGKEVVAWAKEVEERGAGEIVITSVDKEGTGEGFDVKLIKSITDVVNVPVIAHGGADAPEHIVEMVKECGVGGICLASALHYDALKDESFKHKASLTEGNTRFLESNRSYAKINTFGIKELKNVLAASDIKCRI